MTEKQDAGVDPRFDPVFQRGYDPSKHGGRARNHSAESALQSGPARPLSPASPLTPAPLHREPEDPRAPGPEREAPPAPERPPVRDRVAEVAVEPDDELFPPRRNPFRLLLLLASLAAVAGSGLVLWNRIASDPYYYGLPSNDVGARFVDSLLTALLPALLTGGMIGLALWLGLGVLRRRDRE